jgi:hypothetical protein
MYYKIENKECEVYKKLYELRKEEILIQEENRQAIKDKSGLDFESFLGHNGQQNFRRVIQYDGFEFTEPDKVDLKIWQRHKTYSEMFIPNRKTKLGKEMHEFITNRLKCSYFFQPLEILGIKKHWGIIFPYVHVANDVIIIYLDNTIEPEDENVIEITKREFDELMTL